MAVAENGHSVREELTVPRWQSVLGPGHRTGTAGQAARERRRVSQAPDALSRALSLLTEAGRLLAVAGNDALHAGMAGPAVELLTLACDLLAYVSDPAASARALLSLIEALAEAGRASLADAMTARVDQLEYSGAEPEQLALLRLQLARADVMAGEPGRGIARIQDARALQVPPGRHMVGAALDAVEASLIVQTPGEDAGQEAEALARRALTAVADTSHPHIACQAWEVLGTLARRRDLAESTACFREVRVLAVRYRLPFWRLRAQFALGMNEWLVTGATSRLDLIRQAAEHGDVLAVMCRADTMIILNAVLRGRYREAAHLIQQCQARANAAGLTGALRWLAVAQSVLAAHQGRRQDMEAALFSLRQHGCVESRPVPVLLSLSTAVCALLEEDRERARRDCAYEGPCAGAAGTGLHLLLETIADAGQQAPGGTVDGSLFWDQPFLLFRKAVVLGRQGSEPRALAALARAEQLAEPYPLMRHLGLRLVAEAAQQDHWGSPPLWLRQAEQYFHQHPAQAVTNACRSLLRRAGAPVPQRRQDADLIPRGLRVLGVTVREYEVLGVLLTHKSNPDIAAELHISPRTVEKHISALLMKTGQRNRAALIRFAQILAR